MTTVRANVAAPVKHDQMKWPYDVFEELEFPAEMDPQSAFKVLGVSPEAIPEDSKIEIIHRSQFHDPELLKRAQGPGDWFWRWKAIPNHVGRMYGFATAMSAAIDGVWEELAWKHHQMHVEGMTEEQWKEWAPGQRWDRRGY